jgi:hypothetical protein
MSRRKRRVGTVVGLGLVVAALLTAREVLFRAHAPTPSPRDEDHARTGPPN